MKQLLTPGCYGEYPLMVSDEIAVVTSTSGTHGLKLIDFEQNSVMNLPCTCGDCLRYSRREQIAELCRQNGVKHLIMDHTRSWEEFCGSFTLIGCEQAEQFSPRFRRLSNVMAHLEGGLLTFENRRDLLRWCISQPQIFFNQKRIDNKGLIPWLEELRAADKDFDPMRFLGLANAKFPEEQDWDWRSTNIPEVIQGMFGT